MSERPVIIKDLEDLKHIVRNDVVEIEGLLKHISKAFKAFNALIEEMDEKV